MMQTQQPILQEGKPSDQLVEAIRVLFQQWKAWFKNKMRTKDEDFDWSFDMVLVWARYLTKKSVTQTEFIKASELSFDEEWIPNNAKEFLALARKPMTSNYPDIKQAYLAAANGDYKHEVALETAKRVGSWELKTQPESVSYKSWQQHYPIVCEEHSNGASFKVPESHQVEYSHAPVAAGSEADKRISEKLAELRRVAV